MRHAAVQRSKGGDWCFDKFNIVRVLEVEVRSMYEFPNGYWLMKTSDGVGKYVEKAEATRFRRPFELAEFLKAANITTNGKVHTKFKVLSS